MAAGLFGIIISFIGFYIGCFIGEKNPDIWEELENNESVND